jgi:DNA-binding beta-propeller fold protein YncE
MDVMQATSRDPWWSKRNPMRTAAFSCVWRSSGIVGLIVALWGCALVSACTASADDVRPKQDRLFFPSGLAVYPRGNVLFVANANSELRFDSGSIGVIDLKKVQNVIDQAPDATAMEIRTKKCSPDPDHRETLNCDDAGDFLTPEAGVRIGNFATDIAIQDFGTKVRLIVPTRGDPSIAWADYVDERLTCTSGSAGWALCDDAHRLANLQNNPNNPPIPDEPFGVFADAGPSDAGPPTRAGDYGHGFAIVTHLTDSAVTLIDSPANGNAQIVDVRKNLFAADPTTGLRGATGIAGRIQTPGTDSDIVYVGSRTEDRIQTFTVGRPANNALPYLLPSNFFFLDAVGGNPGVGGSTDTRGMQFSQSGDRLYVVNRRPPSLSIFDTSIAGGGSPLNVPSGASDICRQASTVKVFGAGDDERAYVTCFQDGQIYVIDPRGQSQVEDIITVGRGPYSVTAMSYQPVDTMKPQRSLLFVSNFLEDTIAVVDVTPTSAFRNRVVLRIGKPRAP